MFTRTLKSCIVTLAVTTVLIAPGSVLAASPTADVPHLVALIQSNASQKEKADACRQLSLLGTREAVPPLAALLADEKLSHMARYGLETIPDPSVDEVFRASLSKLKGLPLVGVIGSIGVRRDTTAVELLIPFLKDANTEVAQASARSLGYLATPRAAAALESLLAQAPPGPLQAASLEGLMRCAESFASSNRSKEALRIWNKLRLSPHLPHQARAGASTQAIVEQYKKGSGRALLTESLRSTDFIVFDAAIRATEISKNKEITRILCKELHTATGDKQILIAQALGKRGDNEALKPLFAMAKTGQKNSRLAAIRAMAQIPNAQNVPLFLELMKDSEPDIQKLAKESLAAQTGPAADTAVLNMLNSKASTERITGMELAGRRRMVKTLPTLSKLSHDSDAHVRLQAIKQMGELGAIKELPSLLDLLLNSSSSADMDALEKAITLLCSKDEKPEPAATLLAGACEKASAKQKLALIRNLNSVGGPAALNAVRTAIKDPDKEVRATAIRALGTWKTADSAPDLFALAQSAGDPTDKSLSLRSYLNLAANNDLPHPQRLEMCRQAGKLVQKTEEKKLLLAALASIELPDALGLITPYLSESEIKGEACAAALSCADSLLKTDEANKLAPLLIEALKAVVEKAPSPDLANQAKSLLQQAQTKARQK